MPYQEIKNVILEVNEAVLTESMIQVRSRVDLQEPAPLHSCALASAPPSLDEEDPPLPLLTYSTSFREIAISLVVR